MVLIQLPAARRATLATRLAPSYERTASASPAPAVATAPAPRVQGTLQVRQPGHPAASFVSSLGTHLLLLSVVIVATQASVGPALMTSPDTTMVFLPRLRPVPSERMLPRPVLPPVPGPSRGAGMLLVANPPPKGFQTVVAPVDIPAEIPPVDPTERPHDPRDFTGVGVEGGVSYGVVGGVGPVDRSVTSGLGEALFTATSTAGRFVPAQVLFQPAPVYPKALLRAGITGSVHVRFIIDTLGGVESGSIEMLESSYPGFEPAVRATISASRFEPARLGSVPVRQLTEQRVRFVFEGEVGSR